MIKEAVNEWNIVSAYCEDATTYTSEGLDTLRYIGWTLDKPKGFLVHLTSRVDSLGGSLVQSCKILLNLVNPSCRFSSHFLAETSLFHFIFISPPPLRLPVSQAIFRPTTRRLFYPQIKS